MFGKNEVVGQRYFTDHDEAKAEKLKVTSRFLTLQGEGPFAGRPAFFLRLAHCNLACQMCDTYFSDGDWRTTEQLQLEEEQVYRERFGSALPDWIVQRDLVYVITGGEPSLQHRALVPFIKNLKHQHVQIESNGIIAVDWPSSVTLVVSPKAVAGHYQRPLQAVLDRVDALKFVVESPHQISPYNTVPDWALEHRQQTGCEIYLSPMNCYLRQPAKTGTNLAGRSGVDETVSFWTAGLLDNVANQRNHEYAAQYALQHGLRLSLQQHLYASLP